MKMKTTLNKKKVAIVVSICISLIAVIVAVTYSVAYNIAMSQFNKKVAGVNERQAMFDKLSDVDQTVRQDYIGKIDESKLQESLCEGYIEGLPDSYSLYMSDEVYKLYTEIESGKSFNIGVTTILNDKKQNEIVYVLPGSPAEKAGLLKGDVISKINNFVCESSNYEESLLRLTGTQGKNIDLRILRKQGANQIDDIKVTVTCEKTEMMDIEYSLLKDNIGYISIYNFDSLVTKKFENSLNDLHNQGAQNYIIDLRNNLFGKMEYSAQLLDYLLPSGDLISTINKDGEKKLVYSSSGSMVSSKFVVLVNSNTSGSGEIFASAMRDYNAAKIIGENTTGRTTYNKVFRRSDNSAVLIPTAHYVTNKSGILTGIGLLPDKVVVMPTSSRELLDRRSLNLSDDVQVQEAIKELVGEVIES